MISLEPQMLNAAIANIQLVEADEAKLLSFAYSSHSSCIDPRMEDVSESPATPSSMSWTICSKFASEYRVGTEALKPSLASNSWRRPFKFAMAS